MKSFVTALADPQLKGRIPGTDGHEQAKQMIIAKFEQLGLQKVIGDSWEQQYKVYSDELQKHVTCANLLALKPGKPGVNSWILLGAHYDHCMGEDGKIDPGANDNAASVGIVFETIERLQKTNHDCHVLLAIFDTEEPPFYSTKDMGSYVFRKNIPSTLDVKHLKCAVILDLVGHEMDIEGAEHAILAIGLDSSEGLLQPVEQAQSATSLDLYKFGVGIPFSDHMAFEKAGDPFIFLSSGMSWHYHTCHDTVDVLNFSKMERLASFLEQFVIAFNGEGAQLNQDSSAHIPDDKWFANELIRFLDAQGDEKLEKLLLQRPQSNLEMLLYINSILNQTSQKLSKQQLRAQLLRRFSN